MVNVNLPVDDHLRDRDTSRKNKMKEYADSKSYVRPSEIAVGDTVLVRNSCNYNKSKMPYDHNPYKVVKKKHSMITAKRNEREITRNSSFFKPVKPSPVLLDDDEDFDIPNDFDSDTINASEKVIHDNDKLDDDQQDTVKTPVIKLKRERKPPVRFKDYVM